jgi:hypothetical protein
MDSVTLPQGLERMLVAQLGDGSAQPSVSGGCQIAPAGRSKRGSIDRAEHEIEAPVGERFAALADNDVQLLYRKKGRGRTLGRD